MAHDLECKGNISRSFPLVNPVTTQHGTWQHSVKVFFSNRAALHAMYRVVSCVMFDVSCQVIYAVSHIALLFDGQRLGSQTPEGKRESKGLEGARTYKSVSSPVCHCMQSVVSVQCLISE